MQSGAWDRQRSFPDILTNRKENSLTSGAPTGVWACRDQPPGDTVTSKISPTLNWVREIPPQNRAGDGAPHPRCPRGPIPTPRQPLPRMHCHKDEFCDLFAAVPCKWAAVVAVYYSFHLFAELRSVYEMLFPASAEHYKLILVSHPKSVLLFQKWN